MNTSSSTAAASASGEQPSAGPSGSGSATGSATGPEPRRERFYSGPTLSREVTVGWIMKQTVGCMSRVIHDRLAAVGITWAQWPPLLLLDRQPEQTSADLARALSVDAGAMTRMLDRLIEKNLIIRTRCEADRRATRLALTDDGRRAIAPINAVLAETLNDVLRGFSRDEFETLVRLQARLLANAQALAGVVPGQGAAVVSPAMPAPEPPPEPPPGPAHGPASSRRSARR